MFLNPGTFSSTIIEDVIESSRSFPTCAVAYFYFDFADKEKQQVSNLLCSLIAQLLAQTTPTAEVLETLYLRSQHGQQLPDTDGLSKSLKEIIKMPHQTYMIIDALDECTDRGELLKLIEEIVSWKSGNLHLLATSRRERD